MLKLHVSYYFKVYTNKVTGQCYFIMSHGGMFPVGKRKGLQHDKV